MLNLVLMDEVALVLFHYFEQTGWGFCQSPQLTNELKNCNGTMSQPDSQVF